MKKPQYRFCFISLSQKAVRLLRVATSLKLLACLKCGKENERSFVAAQYTDVKSPFTIYHFPALLQSSKITLVVVVSFLLATKLCNYY